jgi:hypothetical protein
MRVERFSLRRCGGVVAVPSVGDGSADAGGVGGGPSMLAPPISVLRFARASLTT